MNAFPSSAPGFTCSLDYSFTGEGTAVPPVAARAELDGGRLALLPSAGPPLLIPLAEVLAIEERDHCIRLSLASGASLTLARLGTRLEDGLLALTAARNDALLDACWMREESAAPPFRAEQTGGDGPRPCELRLMETALVVLYPDADPTRIPYGLVQAVRPENFSVILETCWKGQWSFRKFGRGFEPFVDALATATDALHAAHLDLVRRTLPGLDPAVLRAAAGLLRDGVASPASGLEAAGLLAPLERAAGRAGAGDELAALKQLAGPAGFRAGIKRGLVGDRSGDYLFFLVPIGGGAAIALETARLEGGGEEAEGRATYLFACAGEIGPSLDRLNLDLLDLNFRREPLLIPEDELPRRRPAALDALRGRLLGRAVHRSPEHWKAEVLSLTAASGKGTRYYGRL